MYLHTKHLQNIYKYLQTIIIQPEIHNTSIREIPFDGVLSKLKKTKINRMSVCVRPQQHLWDDEMRNKANGGLNACGSTIFNNLQNNNCNGINIVNEHGDGNGNACINNNQQNQFNGSDKFSPELFAISYTERMRRHSTMSHKIVITFYLTT